MLSQERRNLIGQFLRENTKPVSASSLAKKFNVSRQVIVGDIALLRASGHKISATPRGYILDTDKEGKENIYTIACKHDNKTIADELYIIVDNGGAVLDVTVEHPIYGQITGELQIFSRYDADLFLNKIKKNKVLPLFSLTGGIHIHTIKCNDDESFNRIKEELKKVHIILE